MTTPRSEAEDRQVREIQAAERPEGAPPPQDTRKRWVLIGFVCLLALGVATVIVLFALDGTTAVMFGGAMLLAYIILGGATAIVGVMERSRVRSEVREQIESGRR